MSCLVQIHFGLAVPARAYAAHCLEVADTFARLSGLRWKLWTLSEDGREAGGVYLFDSPEHARAYVEGEVVASLRKNPAFRSVEVRVRPVLHEPSLRTGAGAVL